MQVQETSGSPELDNQVLEAVRSAAPFEPFPIAVREQNDVLQLIKKYCSDSVGSLFVNTNG